jgi:hypothetical protein
MDQTRTSAFALLTVFRLMPKTSADLFLVNWAAGTAVDP